MQCFYAQIWPWKRGKSPARGMTACDFTEEACGEVRIERMLIKNHAGEARLKKPQGHYITLTLPPLTDNALLQNKIKPLADELRALLPLEGLILVAGLGNSSITPDALGPQAARQVLATRHITGRTRPLQRLGACAPSPCWRPAYSARPVLRRAS